MNLFAYVRAFIASVALFVPLSIGAYFYGRSDGYALAVSEQRAANEVIRAGDADVRGVLVDRTRQSAEAATLTESENDAIEDNLTVPSDGDDRPFAGNEWVRQLQGLK